MPVDSGIGTLKDALNEAIRDWVTNVRTPTTSSAPAAGPAPYPEIVARAAGVIGAEAREQMLAEEGRLPAPVVACVGGGSNAIGIFRAFLDDDGVALHGVEAGGEGVETRSPRRVAEPRRARRAARHATPTCCRARRGRSPSRTRSRRASTTPASARSTASCATRGACGTSAPPTPRRCRRSSGCCRSEGIIPALESSHALALIAREGAVLGAGGPVLVCLSGRGDKDVDAVGAALGLDG